MTYMPSKAEIGGLKNLKQDVIDKTGGPTDLMRKGDFVPEIFFIGQIVGGSEFNVSQDGLFVEAYLNFGEDWTHLEDDSLSGPIQTHTAYADEEGFFVFAHPFEYHFAAKSATGWPKLSIKVWRVDDMGKIDNISYGVINLPNQTGHFDMEIPTWRPMRGWTEESYNFFLGGPPKLQNSDPVVKNLDQRRYLTSMSSGTVHLVCDVLKKGFKAQNIN